MELLPAELAHQCQSNGVKIEAQGWAINYRILRESNNINML